MIPIQSHPPPFIQGRIQDLSEGGAPYEKWGGGRYTKSGGRAMYEKWGGGGQFASGPIYEKWGGGGQFASGPIYEKWGGGRAIRFRSDIRKVGGGGNSLQVRYEKWGGAVHFRSDIRKVGGGGGGGGAIRFRYDTKSGGGEFASGPIRKVERGGADTFVWHKENTLSLIINGYKEGAQALHTRARMNLNVVFNFIHSLIVFILEMEGGARAP